MTTTLVAVTRRIAAMSPREIATVLLTLPPTTLLPDDRVQPWAGQAALYPAKMTPGFHYLRATGWGPSIESFIEDGDPVELWVDCILHYDASGHIDGIFNYDGCQRPHDCKTWTFIRPDARSHGNGVALFRAVQDFGLRPDLTAEQFTAGGWAIASAWARGLTT